MLIRAAALSIFATILAGTMAAAGVAQWDGDQRAAIRLIGGGTRTEAGQTKIDAAVEIRLAPGWKTYWRYPGDSGVPPQFNFAKSENVKAVTVSWPAPQRIDDSEGVTIGYKGGVVFPLTVEPQDATKPVLLRLKFDYAICEKLCVPAEGKSELSIKPGAPSAPAIAMAQKSVPQARSIGADGMLSVKTVRQDNDGKRVLVDVAAPAGAKVAVFAEGPSPDWALPVPERTEGAAAGLHRFSFAIDGVPPGSSPKGAILRITAVAGDDAIETTFRLD